MLDHHRTISTAPGALLIYSPVVLLSMEVSEFMKG